MANLKKIRNTWFARIRFSGREVCVSLGTSDKPAALERLITVNRFEAAIKDGQKVTFPWQSEDGETAFRFVKLSETITQFLEAKKSDLRQSSLDGYALVLKKFSEFVGDIDLRDLTQEHLSRYKLELIEKCLSSHTINSYLVQIRTFLNWIMNEGKYSGRRLRIQKMKTDSAPTYVSDIDFARIYALATEFKPLLAESYTLYRDTGMRLTEGFSATLNGNILVVPSSKSKSHIARKIILTAEQIPVWEAMVKEFVPDYLSRKFHDFCRELGIDRHFHDLRHSYGVRTWLKTKDLFFVKKTMGHSTVSVTEKYCDFDFAELQRDFPELTKELSYFAPKYKVAQ